LTLSCACIFTLRSACDIETQKLYFSPSFVVCVFQLDNADEQAAQVRRELDSRLQQVEQMCKVGTSAHSVRSHSPQRDSSGHFLLIGCHGIFLSLLDMFAIFGITKFVWRKSCLKKAYFASNHEGETPLVPCILSTLFQAVYRIQPYFDPSYCVTFKKLNNQNTIFIVLPYIKQI